MRDLGLVLWFAIISGAGVWLAYNVWRWRKPLTVAAKRERLEDMVAIEFSYYQKLLRK